ncbi:MAG: GPW/gp25 family protein [bacterium]|nr:GPW/gp25 family protein [bacterium]
MPIKKSFRFPFEVIDGSISGSTGEKAIQGKIIQVLFTAPGERVNLPEFGTGLFNLVFDPNNMILAAAMEFTIGEALARWMDEDIILDAVNVQPEEEKVFVEIVYTSKADLSKQALRVQFK